jgi:hypothetical protein
MGYLLVSCLVRAQLPVAWERQFSMFFLSGESA